MYEYSFYVVFIVLATTGTITFIEAMRTKNPLIRHILNLETCISIVAAYFYGLFITRMEAHNLKEILHLRYLDWSITTPMMLLSLILTVIYATGSPNLRIVQFLTVMALNYSMLLSGYLGETETISKIPANLLGFAFLAGTLTYIYKTFMKKYTLVGTIMFSTYAVIWSLYGIVYFFEEHNKMIGYNVLDLIAKCLVGLFLWAYFVKVIV